MDEEHFPFTALRERIAQLHAEGREQERESAAWDLANRLARLGERGFNPARRPLRLRYPLIEAS